MEEASMKIPIGVKLKDEALQALKEGRLELELQFHDIEPFSLDEHSGIRITILMLGPNGQSIEVGSEVKH